MYCGAHVHLLTVIDADSLQFLNGHIVIFLIHLSNISVYSLP